jgi:hypothetical protein
LLAAALVLKLAGAKIAMVDITALVGKMKFGLFYSIQFPDPTQHETRSRAENIRVVAGLDSWRKV